MRNQRGQSLIEYLIIVSIIAVGSIAIMRSLGESVYVRFANVTNALQGRDNNIQPDSVGSDQYQKKGLNDFFRGAGH